MTTSTTATVAPSRLARLSLRTAFPARPQYIKPTLPLKPTRLSSTMANIHTDDNASLLPQRASPLDAAVLTHTSICLSNSASFARLSQARFPPSSFGTPRKRQCLLLLSIPAFPTCLGCLLRLAGEGLSGTLHVHRAASSLFKGAGKPTAPLSLPGAQRPIYMPLAGRDSQVQDRLDENTNLTPTAFGLADTVSSTLVRSPKATPWSSPSVRLKRTPAYQHSF